MEKKIVNDKSRLLNRTESVMHYVKIDPKGEEYMKVWVKDPTFLQLEQAQMKLFNINAQAKDVQIDIVEVYHYLFEAFVEKTEPSLNPLDLIRLNPYVGNQIKSILPDPFAIMEEDTDLKAN
tara:strand:- start:1747 stop:2112 length:366 start_codon:yes stop_codon:yes gene_type:complete